MKRIVVFLLSFLLLVVISISGSGNNAFAAWHGYPSSLAVVNLVCQVSGFATAGTFNVYAYSTNIPTSAGIFTGEDCGTALTALATAGLKITNVQSTGSGFVVYTLSGRIQNVLVE